MIIEDFRKEIIDAKAWKPEFIVCDTSSGIKLGFTAEEFELKNGERRFSIVTDGPHILENVHITFWKYPIDTVVKTTVTKNHLLSLPSNEVVDITTINYEIKNIPVEKDITVSSDKSLYVNVKPGSYLIKVSPAYYAMRCIKDIIIKPNHWSVIKIDTVYNFVMPNRILY
jgi:hypothetical protein